jgi:hypothetical protein
LAGTQPAAVSNDWKICGAIFPMNGNAVIVLAVKELVTFDDRVKLERHPVDRV